MPDGMITCLLQAVQKTPEGDLMLEKVVELPFLPSPGIVLCFDEGGVSADKDSISVWDHKKECMIVAMTFAMPVGPGKKNVEKRVETLWRNGWTLRSTTKHLLEGAKHRKYYSDYSLTLPASMP